MTSNETPSPSGGPAGESRGLTARQRATAKRDLLRRRAQRIRRSVAAVTAALFCAFFLVVYVQLASGHDPALSAASKNTSTGSTNTKSEGASSAAAKKAAEAEEAQASETSGTSETSAAESSSGTSESGESSASSGSSSGESESSVSSVKTSQS